MTWLTRGTLFLFALSLTGCLDFGAAEQQLCDGGNPVCGSSGVGGGTDAGGTEADAGEDGGGGGTDGGADGGPDAGGDAGLGADAGEDGGSIGPTGTDWVRAIGMAGPNDNVTLTSISATPEGGAWFAGSFTGGALITDVVADLTSTSGGTDALFVRYGADGTPTRFFALGGATISDTGSLAVEDNAGRLWVAARSNAWGTIDFGGKVFNVGGGSGYGSALARYGTDGGVEWFYGLASTNNSEATVDFVRPLPGGGAALTGYTNGQVAIADGNGAACSGSNVGKSQYFTTVTDGGLCGARYTLGTNGAASTMWDFAVVPDTGDLLAVLQSPGGSPQTSLFFGSDSSNGKIAPSQSPVLFYLPSDGGLPAFGILTAPVPETVPMKLAVSGNKAWVAGTFSGNVTIKGTALTADGGTDVFISRVAPANVDYVGGSVHTIGGPGNDSLVGLTTGKNGLQLVINTAGGFTEGGVTVDGDGGMLVLDYDPNTGTFSNGRLIASFDGGATQAITTPSGDLLFGGSFRGAVSFAPDASVAEYPGSPKPNTFVGRLAR